MTCVDLSPASIVKKSVGDFAVSKLSKRFINLDVVKCGAAFDDEKFKYV